MSLELRVRGDGMRALLDASGEIDARTAPLLREGVARALAAGARTIELDLSRVTFVDSSGLGAILGRHRAIAAAGGQLVLVAPSPQATRLLEITALDEVLEIRATSSTAPPDSRSARHRAGRTPPG